MRLDISFSLFRSPLGLAVCLSHLLQAALLSGWHLPFIPRSWYSFNTLWFSLCPVHCADFTESGIFSQLVSWWVLLTFFVMVTLRVPEGRS